MQPVAWIYVIGSTRVGPLVAATGAELALIKPAGPERV